MAVDFYDGPQCAGGELDYLIGNLAPGLPATIPAHDPDAKAPEELYDTNQGGGGLADLFRLGVVPDRNYRVELRAPETTDGRPANVGIIVFLGYLPYFDFGLDEGEGPGSFVYRYWLLDDQRNGDISIEFKAQSRERSITSAKNLAALRCPMLLAADMDSVQAGPHGKAVMQDGALSAGADSGCWWYWYGNRDAPSSTAPIDLGAQLYVQDPQRMGWRVPLDNPFRVF